MAKAVPTMSMMESRAPTSCRCTFSMVVWCTAASASARRLNIPIARAFAPAGSAAFSIAATMCFK